MFGQQAYSLHFKDILHKLYFIFHKVLYVSFFFFFSVANNTFFTNHALKFRYPPGGIMVECYAKLNLKYPITEYGVFVCVCIFVCVCMCVLVSALTWNGGGMSKGRNM